MYEHLNISMNGRCDLDSLSPAEIRASLDELISRMGQHEPEIPEPTDGVEDGTA
jgi:hypothetical protein